MEKTIGALSPRRPAAITGQPPERSRGNSGPALRPSSVAHRVRSRYSLAAKQDPGRAGARVKSLAVFAMLGRGGTSPGLWNRASDRNVESPPPGRPQWEAQAPQQKPPSFAGPFFEQAEP